MRLRAPHEQPKCEFQAIEMTKRARRRAMVSEENFIATALGLDRAHDVKP
jgi:hypothetical protein